MIGAERPPPSALIGVSTFKRRRARARRAQGPPSSAFIEAAPSPRATLHDGYRWRRRDARHGERGRFTGHIRASVIRAHLLAFALWALERSRTPSERSRRVTFELFTRYICRAGRQSSRRSRFSRYGYDISADWPASSSRHSTACQSITSQKDGCQRGIGDCRVSAFVESRVRHDCRVEGWPGLTIEFGHYSRDCYSPRLLIFRFSMRALHLSIYADVYRAASRREASAPRAVLGGRTTAPRRPCV